MGPRFGERGDAELYNALREAGQQLQWGRALVSAETSRSAGNRLTLKDASMGPRFGERGDMRAKVLSVLRDPLQWGRALVSAETRFIVKTVIARFTGFNGAALW